MFENSETHQNVTGNALAEPVGEPYGHVTVRRLPQRFANHVDQYTFYPAGDQPYLDNVDECIAVYTAPQPQQPAEVPLLTDDEIRKLADKSDEGQESLEFMLAFARAIEQAVRQKAGLK